MATVHSLCMFVRFTGGRHSGLGAFYEDAIGLSRIRSFRHVVDWKRQDKDIFWGGECILFETFYNGLAEIAEDDGQPEQARLVPVFRTDDLDALVAAWRSRGVDIVSIVPAPQGGRQAYVRDPAGLLFAAREIGTAVSAQDREAERRRKRGEAFNPGCRPMPAHLQEIGWVQRRVADVNAGAAFYAGVLGMDLIDKGDGWAHYDLGDNSILELIAGGTARSAPKAQMETTGALIARVDDVIALRDKARAAGFAVVNELYAFPRGKLSYVADAEGNVFGLYTAVHPSEYLAAHPPMPEDTEAARRLAEAMFARNA